MSQHRSITRSRGRCLECRRRRRKCTLDRPSCDRCRRTKSACVYQLEWRIDPHSASRPPMRATQLTDKRDGHGDDDDDAEDIDRVDEDIDGILVRSGWAPSATIDEAHDAEASSRMNDAEFIDLVRGLSSTDAADMIGTLQPTVDLKHSMPIVSAASLGVPEVVLKSPQLHFFWQFYLQSTARYFAIHEYETPYVWTLAPMAVGTPHLVHALLHMAVMHRTKQMSMPATFYQELTKVLYHNAFRSLQTDVNASLTLTSQSNDEACLATCLALCTSFINSNQPNVWQTHLNGAKYFAKRCLYRKMGSSFTKWFLLKWLSYTFLVCNLGITGVGESDDTGDISIESYWDEGEMDPESDKVVDPLLGFSCDLAPLLLRLVTLTKRKQQGEDPATEIHELETKLWMAHEAAAMRRVGLIVVPGSQEEQLLGCDEAFHAAALIHFYARLRGEPSHSSQIQTQVRAVCEATMKIPATARTSAALLFAFFSAGSHAFDEERTYIMSRLDQMEIICLASVATLYSCLREIWAWLDGQDDPCGIESVYMEMGR